MQKLIISAIAITALLAGCVKGGNDTEKPTPTPETPVITITTQPAPATTVTEGNITGSLTIVATATEGATLSYQWHSGNNSGAAIPGATEAEFTIPTDLTAAGGIYWYFCEVSATGGATPVISDTATVTVKEPEYVSINGVKWAKTNVNAPGTFAAKPEDGGMFYQWNRKKAWSATGETVTGWDTTNELGDSWEAANDPCPEGWRVPAKDEFEALCDRTKVTSEWTTENGVNGGRFTDTAGGKSVFFPAAGFRDNDSGELRAVDINGNYWSALPYGIDSGYFLWFDSDGFVTGDKSYRSYGFSVRCVAK